jgi:predicted SprT family Zn-dependent metalloprotease
MLIHELKTYTCSCGATFKAPSRPTKGKVFRCEKCRRERHIFVCRRAAKKRKAIQEKQAPCE